MDITYIKNELEREKNRSIRLKRIMIFFAGAFGYSFGVLMGTIIISYINKRLSEMRQMPERFAITDTWENGANKFGEPTRYKRYFIKEVVNATVT